jgi:hypothetical protein
MSLVLNVEILGEFKKLTAATQGAQSSLEKLQNGVGGIARGIGRTIGALAVTLGFTSIVQGFKNSVEAAEEAVVANQRIDAIALSMNEFGNQTAKVTDRIKKFADETELSVGVDGEVIKATQAKLLTFRNLTKTADKMGGSFDRATIAALDMAAAGFGEATSNATQLGKALNDPIAGITALNRSGIQFTEDQKALIESLVESGDVLAAQEIILKEVEDQVGGTAAATATASDKIGIAFGEISEGIGTLLLPAINEFSEKLVAAVPEIKAFFAELIDPTTEVGSSFQGMNRIFESTGDQFKYMMDVFAGGDFTFKTVLDWITVLVGGLGQLLFMLGRVAMGFSALFRLDFGEIIRLGSNFATDYQRFVNSQNRAIAGEAVNPGFGAMGQGQVGNVVINVNNGNVTAQEIADKINRGNRSTGTNLIR